MQKKAMPTTSLSDIIDVRTLKKEQVRKLILEKASSEFALHGIKAVKMDDIASSLKISKRTVYEAYSNKRDLVSDVLILKTEQFKKRMQAFIESNPNAMDTLLEFFRIQLENYSQTNPSFFHDLSKYPDVLERMHRYNDESDRHTKEFFLKGVEEGYFLDNVNYNLLAMLCNDTFKDTRSNPKYSKYDLKDMFHSFVCVIVRGFCTQKGLMRLDQFLNDITVPSINDDAPSK